MARTRLPPNAEMAQFVAHWLERVQGDVDIIQALRHGDVLPLQVDGLALDEAVKLHFRAWQFVQLCEEKGEPLAEITVRRFLATDESDREAALQRERVVFVPPLGRHYRLPLRTPKTVLNAAATLGLLSGWHRPESVPARALYPTYRNAPSFLVDRATRGHGAAWDAETLTFRDDEIDFLHVRYQDDALSPERQRETLQQLDPRASDVWRLLLAKAIEHDRDETYTPVTLELNELTMALGLKPHPKGGMRAKDLIKVNDALAHLERLWLVATPGGTQRLQIGPPGVTSEGKVAVLETGTRVIAVMRKGSLRTVGGQQVPAFWDVVLGDWVKVFSRHYAPIFRSLIELPASSSVNKWAKQLGTELAYLYRAAGDANVPAIRLTVEDLLRRATLLDEVAALQRRRRVNEAAQRFEETMDLLCGLGVHRGWAYAPGSAETLAALEGRSAWLDAWLTSDVEVQPPVQLLQEFGRMLRHYREETS